ncbi:MAG: DUF5703 domain-containing protein, partial [Bacteroidales bacterium]
MKKSFFIRNSLIIISVSFIITNKSVAQPAIDLRSLISAADLTYNEPVVRREEGMPVGNGRMGSLVWTTPSSLKFQINRVDIFGNNCASNNFFERNTDYCSGAGFVDIDFVTWGEDVFDSPGFNQHLSCYDGIVSTTGRKVSTRTMVWNEQDVMTVGIQDQREIPQAICISLRMLRDTVVKRGNHTATSRLKIVDNQIVLTQSFEEDRYYCGSSVAIGISGRQVRVRRVNNSELQLIVKPGNEPFTVYISSAATFNKDKDIITVSKNQLKAAISRGFEDILLSNGKWWETFWGKSFIHITSPDGEADFIEKNYNYFMYVMASSSLGDFPPKFNGMIWTTGGDSRKWGNMYWGANQSCM